MTAFFAPALTALLLVSVVVAWVPARWAVSVLEAGAFLLAAAWVAGWMARGGRPRGHWLLAPLAAAPAWGLLQLAANRTVYRHATWESVLLWGTNLALFLLALQAFSAATARRRFLRATLIFGFGVSVLATLQLFTSTGKVFWIFPANIPDAVLGPFLSRNQYAAFVELVLPVALAGAWEGGRKAPACVFMAAAMYASVVASASRAGFILVSLEVVVIAAAGIRRGRILAWMGLLAALFTAVVGWDLLWNRMRQPDPYAGRREMFFSSLDMIRARPGMGFGLGNWPAVYPAYARVDDGLFANHAHNDWAEWASEGGLPFLAFVAAIAAWSLRPALRSRWGIGILSVFAHAVVDYPFQKPALAALVFVFLAVLTHEHE